MSNPNPSPENQAQAILVRIEHVYGRPLVYPVCDKAKLFAELLRQKTLNNGLEQIKALGFEVSIAPPKI